MCVCVCVCNVYIYTRARTLTDAHTHTHTFAFTRCCFTSKLYCGRSIIFSLPRVSLFCEYIHLECIRTHGIYRVRQSEYVIHILVVIRNTCMSIPHLAL